MAQATLVVSGYTAAELNDILAAMRAKGMSVSLFVHAQEELLNEVLFPPDTVVADLLPEAGRARLGDSRVRSTLSQMGITDIKSLESLTLERLIYYFRPSESTASNNHRWLVMALVLQMMIEYHLSCANGILPANVLRHDTEVLKTQAPDPEWRRVFSVLHFRNIFWLELLAYLPERRWRQIRMIGYGTQSYSALLTITQEAGIYPLRD